MTKIKQFENFIDQEETIDRIKSLKGQAQSYLMLYLSTKQKHYRLDGLKCLIKAKSIAKTYGLEYEYIQDEDSEVA